MEATLSLFIPLLAVNDEIRLVSMKYLPPLNHNDCQDLFPSHKDKQVRDGDLHNDSLESSLFSYTLLCFPALVRFPVMCLQALLLMSLVFRVILFF